MKRFLVFDSEGLYNRDEIAENIENLELAEGEQYKEVGLDEVIEGFYQLKLVDGELVEGLSQEEIEAIKNQPKELSMEEQLALAIAELDAQRERDKTAIQLAITELAAMLLGGE